MKFFNRFSEASQVPDSGELTQHEEPVNYNVVPTPPSLVNPGADVNHLTDEDMEDMEAMHRRKRTIKIAGAVVSGVAVTLAIVLAVTLSSSSSSSKSGPEQTLSGGENINSFDALWGCKDSKSDAFGPEFCSAPDRCSSDAVSPVQCCMPNTATGLCETEVDYSRCDLGNAPSDCTIGNHWTCQRPGATEIVAVYSAAYCDAAKYPAPCDQTTQRSKRCCPASAGVTCLDSKALSADACADITPVPAECDPVATSGASIDTPTTSETVNSTSNSTETGSNNGTSGTSGTKTEESFENLSTSAPTTTVAPTTTPAPTTTNAPTTAAPPASSPGPGKKAVGVTVYNNCGGDTRIYAGPLGGADTSKNAEVPPNCMNGNFCQNYRNVNNIGSFAFWLAKTNFPNQNQAARTLAEINLESSAWWYDVSRVKGYNVGIKIEYSHADGSALHKVVCNNPNCDDAYWMCDTAMRNVFYPDYRGDAEGSFVIVFCPNEPDTFPYAFVAHKRHVNGPTPIMCDCDAGSWIRPNQQVPPVGTVLTSSDMCGPINSK